MAGTASSGGRNRKSLAEHAVSGTGRKNRGTQTTEMTPTTVLPPSGRPIRPTRLRGPARAEWTAMVARLELAGTLSTVDDAALYQYCCLFGETEGIADKRRAAAVLVATMLAAVDRLVAAAEDHDISGAIAAIAKLEQQDVKRTTQLRQDTWRSVSTSSSSG